MSKRGKRKPGSAVTPAGADSSSTKKPPPIVDLASDSRAETSFTARLAVRTGPLPPPAEMARYQQIDPAIVITIMKAFEAEGAHRHQLETDDQAEQWRAVREDVSTQRLGITFGFAVVLAVLGAGITFAVLDFPKLAGATIGIDVIGLAGAFISAQRTRAKERAEAARNLDEDE